MPSSLLAALGRIRFFLLGLLADAALLLAAFLCVWRWTGVDCRGGCTAAEYLSLVRYILWVELVSVVGLWPLSLPALAAPPGIGLWMDLRKSAARG